VAIGKDQFGTKAPLNLDTFKEKGFDRNKGDVTLKATLTRTSHPRSPSISSRSSP
jgi:hypothetical protein